MCPSAPLDATPPGAPSRGARRLAFGVGLQLIPDLGVLAFVGRDPGRLRRELVRVGLLLVALQRPHHVGYPASAEEPGHEDDRADSRPRAVELGDRGACLAEPRRPYLGVAPFVGGDPLECRSTLRIVLHLGQPVVENDCVALQLQIGQAALAFLGGQ